MCVRCVGAIGGACGVCEGVCVCVFWFFLLQNKWKQAQ